MKKFLKRISEMMILFSSLFYNFCYADLIDPDFPATSETMNVLKPNHQLERVLSNIAFKIVFGIAIASIVVPVLYSFIKVQNKKKSQNEVKDEKENNDNI